MSGHHGDRGCAFSSAHRATASEEQCRCCGAFYDVMGGETPRETSGAREDDGTCNACHRDDDARRVCSEAGSPEQILPASTNSDAPVTFVSTGDEPFARLTPDEDRVLTRCLAAATRAQAIDILAFAYTDGRVSTLRIHGLRRTVVAHFGSAL